MTAALQLHDRDAQLLAHLTEPQESVKVTLYFEVTSVTKNRHRCDTTEEVA